MTEIRKYELATIERFDPSLQEIGFELTSTALDQQIKIQSLAFSDTSFYVQQINQVQPEQQNTMKKEEKQIQIKNNGDKKGERSKLKIKQGTDRGANKNKKKQKQSLRFAKATILFDDSKNKKKQLQNSGSTIHKSFQSTITQSFILNRNKKNNQVSIPKKQKQIKNVILSIENYNQKNCVPLTPILRTDTRKKIFSLRK